MEWIELDQIMVSYSSSRTRIYILSRGYLVPLEFSQPCRPSPCIPKSLRNIRLENNITLHYPPPPIIFVTTLLRLPFSLCSWVSHLIFRFLFGRFHVKKTQLVVPRTYFNIVLPSMYRSPWYSLSI